VDDAATARSRAAELEAGAQAVDATGAALYRALAAGSVNAAFSPTSIAIALRLALSGARSQTAAELARFLHVPGPEEAAAGLRALTASAGGGIDIPGGPAGPGGAGGRDVTFRMPNTMWVQSGLPLAPGFTARLRDAAGPDVRTADFARAAGEVTREINKVIAEQTAGKIVNLIAPGVITALTRLVLANAIYLKARWAHPFTAGATGGGPFHLGGGPVVTARMMRVTAQFGYLRGGGHQTVLLPYAGSRLAMAVILPDGPLGPLEDRLATGGTRGLTSGARPASVALTLPKFRVTTGFRLGAALRTLGVAAAFSEHADFSGITTAEPLRIDEVVHKAYVDVDEQGTEAAAATATVIRAMALTRPSQPPITVVVDRPFLFAIADTVAGTPLFLGKVGNPTAA
jgi:serine protease inhibitor